MAGHDTAGREPPRALPWTLLDFGSDMMVVVPAFSAETPTSCDITVLDRAPGVTGGEASRLALSVHYADGTARSFALDAMSEESQAAVQMARNGSVVVVEEDPASPNGRRHAYIAEIRHPSGGAQGS